MINEAISKRRSVREFRQDSVNPESIREILEAAIFAPSAMGNHALEFIVIQKTDIKTLLYEAQIGGKQKFLENAPVIIAVITDIDKTEYPVQDLAVASENIMIQAADLNLGSVWKNVDGVYKTKVRGILNLPESYEIINLICLGYPENKVKPHKKSDYTIKIHKDKFI